MIDGLRTLHNVQDQSWVLIGMEVNHITQWTISEGGTKHRDIILGGEKQKTKKKQGKKVSTSDIQDTSVPKSNNIF